MSQAPACMRATSNKAAGNSAPVCHTSCRRQRAAARTALRVASRGWSTAGRGSHLDVEHDLVLSSGFLAFANHSGFLDAIVKAGIPVAGVMGTSAGAITGSLYCAGYEPRHIAMELSRAPPIQFLRPCLDPSRGGLLSLEGVVERLRELLPPTFEDLDREFAVGVVTCDGEHVLIDSGSLPEAVAASAAIPYMFASVDVPGQPRGPFKDGGIVDRIALRAWRDRRRRQLQLLAAGNGNGNGKSAPFSPPPAFVHVIHRSSPFSGFDDALGTGESNIHIVSSPRSGVNFFDLGNFEEQFTAAYSRTQPVLALAQAQHTPRSKRSKKRKQVDGKRQYA